MLSAAGPLLPPGRSNDSEHIIRSYSRGIDYILDERSRELCGEQMRWLTWSEQES